MVGKLNMLGKKFGKGIIVIRLIPKECLVDSRSGGQGVNHWRLENDDDFIADYVN